MPPAGGPSDSIGPLVDGLFRRVAGRLTAQLARRIGTRGLELAEDAVAHAFLQALRNWPTGGVPEQPEAWLTTVAKNAALDRLRQGRHIAALPIDDLLADLPPGEAHFAGEIADDELALLFACCHPALTVEQQVTLTLKLGCGFGVREIARLMLADERAVQQRLVRAKRILAEDDLPVSIPAGAALDARLGAVHQALYLMFTEGHSATDAPSPIRPELVAEAIRLAELLLGHTQTATPEGSALAALFCFHAARLPARHDAPPLMALLEEQDRSRWDTALRDRGVIHLHRSARGDRISPWHVEAEIAACHTLAPSFAGTDWQRLKLLYRHLTDIKPGPMPLLAAAIATGYADGPGAGLAALDRLAAGDVGPMAPYLAARAEFLGRNGDRAGACRALDEALALPLGRADRTLLAAKRRRMADG
ncbi:MAG: DUF6596 domain-containing protein [Dongiaceae bacterium]